MAMFNSEFIVLDRTQVPWDGSIVPRPERTRSLPGADVSETWPGETRDTDSAVTSDSKTDTSTQHLMV